jgi:hypothetical protein
LIFKLGAKRNSIPDLAGQTPWDKALFDSGTRIPFDSEMPIEQYSITLLLLING